MKRGADKIIGAHRVGEDGATILRFKGTRSSEVQNRGHYLRRRPGAAGGVFSMCRP